MITRWSGNRSARSDVKHNLFKAAVNVLGVALVVPVVFRWIW